MNFPFHPEAGSHTSILMSESGLGLSMATTRQKAGSARNASARAAVGGANAPASTGAANVIVTFGSPSVAKPSHGKPAVEERANTRAAKIGDRDAAAKIV